MADLKELAIKAIEQENPEPDDGRIPNEYYAFHDSATPQAILELCERVERLEAVLPSGEKLIQLAAWLDLKYPDDDNEVQEDLRRWGYGIQDALSGVSDETK